MYCGNAQLATPAMPSWPPLFNTERSAHIVSKNHYLRLDMSLELRFTAVIFFALGGRYHSLSAYNGEDDMFSSDLSDDQLRMRLGHMSNTPCQIIFSMADEYVPDYVDKKALVDRLCRAMGGAEKVEIEWGNHALSNRVQEAVQAIIDFVKREGPKGWDDPWKFLEFEELSELELEKLFRFRDIKGGDGFRIFEQGR
ncbi:unnamed protein product [Thlaspi arvense]|uniref:Uncharacterized protein n=1 Tax=Thlaspi arvense TaxID=13288 RepID=A0AAU9RRZ0_THLAR|nr:unnamed protein product [Thlaspi arvense]